MEEGFVEMRIRLTWYASPITALAIVLWSLGCPTGGDPGGDGPPPEDWVPISGGTFEMGSADGEPDELPIHTVTVPDFEMWRTEVTASQYQRCVDAEACSQTVPAEACNLGHDDRPDHPMNCIGREQAEHFCEWVGGRLPSEAEWEYAARSGGQDILHPWGDDPATCDRAVLSEGGDGCGTDLPSAVCSKSPDGDTDQGLCDMSGNVMEWIADFYHGCYDCSQCAAELGCDAETAAPDDGSAWMTPNATARVRRGGGFRSEADALRAASRSYGTFNDSYVGIRCAR